LQKEIERQRRIEQSVVEYRRAGTPVALIDTYKDMSGDEKAELLDLVLTRARGRPAKFNKYRQPLSVQAQKSEMRDAMNTSAVDKAASDKLRLMDAYHAARETRQFEIGLFWQRSNYFLVLNTGVAVAFFSLKSSEFATPLALFGLIGSWLWFYVTLGSKYWQSRWEQRLKVIELLFDSSLDLFAAEPHVIDQDVRDSLKVAGPDGFAACSISPYSRSRR
jgi:hypothetical protein